ncbi:MAG TPA: hypothetical protein PLD10_01030 [Rhodopila sp.]|nr:hypothetical protein [Rhodopila sp.]
MSGLNGMLMGSDPRVILQSSTTGQGGTARALDLCERCRTLNERRINLDHRLSTLADDDPERDLLWEALETILAAFPGLIKQLAVTDAANQAELQAKASILALLLQEPQSDSVALSPEMRGLAISVANDVLRLI